MAGFVAEVAHFGGPHGCGRRIRGIIAHLKHVGALVAEADGDPHVPATAGAGKNPTLFRATGAVVHRAGQGRACASGARCAPSATTCAGFPAWGRGAHLQHGRAPSRLDDLAPARVGVCRSWPSTARPLRHGCCSRNASSSTWRGSSARAAGADEWYGARAASDPAAGRPRACAKCGGTEFRKETDILDVWFDSGCSHAAVLETRPELRWPAELYLEGSDQHRGLVSTPRCWRRWARGTRRRTRRCSPAASSSTGEGRKDVEVRRQRPSSPPSPSRKYGAEVLRLWGGGGGLHRGHPALDPDHGIVSPTPTGRMAQHLPPSCSANLGDFDPARRTRQAYAQLDEVDRWILDRARAARRPCAAGPTRNISFHIVFHSVHNFCAVGPLGPLPRRDQGPAVHVGARRPAAPRRPDGVLRHLPDARAADGADPDLHRRGGRGATPPAPRSESVHLERFSRGGRWSGSTTRSRRSGTACLEVRREVAKALETARAGRKLIGSGLEARVRIESAPEDCAGAARRQGARCCRRCSSSRASTSEGGGGRGACATRARTSPGSSSASTARRGRSASGAWDTQRGGRARSGPSHAVARVWRAGS